MTSESEVLLKNFQPFAHHPLRNDQDWAAWHLQPLFRALACVTPMDRARQSHQVRVGGWLSSEDVSGARASRLSQPPVRMIPEFVLDS